MMDFVSGCQGPEVFKNSREIKSNKEKCVELINKI